MQFEHNVFGKLPNVVKTICFATKHCKYIFNTGSGTIDFDELKTVLLSCMEESCMKLSDEDINDLTRALFNEADEDGSGEITFEELVAELDKYPDIRDNLTMR